MLRYIAGPMLHLLLLVQLLLLLPPTNAFSPHLNRTLCCEAAILASATDHIHFPLNFALWNSFAQLNDSIPPLPQTPENAVWNALVHRRSTQNPRVEYLDFRCGATYSPESLAAMPIPVPLTWARRNPACMGYEGVPLASVDEWASPVLSFLLPAVIFGLSIPTGWSLTITEVLRISTAVGLYHPSSQRRWLGPLRALLGPSVKLTMLLVLSILEMIRWAIVILVCAGPILSSALQEMQLDHFLLSELTLPPNMSAPSAATELRLRRLLLALLLSNVADADGKLSKSTGTTVLHAPAAEARAHLNILLTAHMPFDVAVGAPVAFYTLAYSYALFDAYQRLGDLPTAAALMFGLWYSVFVLIAVVSAVRDICPPQSVVRNRLTETRRPVSTRLRQYG